MKKKTMTKVTASNTMDTEEKNTILKREISKFLKSNPKIKSALEMFEISEEQYSKAMRSIDPQATTSNEIIIEIEAWNNGGERKYIRKDLWWI